MNSDQIERQIRSNESLAAVVFAAQQRLVTMPRLLAVLILLPWTISTCGAVYVHGELQGALSEAQAAREDVAKRAQADRYERRAMTALAAATGDCEAYKLALEAEALGGSQEARKMLDRIRKVFWGRCRELEKTPAD